MNAQKPLTGRMYEFDYKGERMKGICAGNKFIYGVQTGGAVERREAPVRECSRIQEFEVLDADM